jgi:hypothetical protein
MNSAVGRCRVYDPEAINMMGQAFDRTVRCLSEQSKTNLHIRRNLALCIIRLFDEGESNSLCISKLALAIVTSPSKAREQWEPLSSNSIGVLIPSGTGGRPVAA